MTSIVRERRFACQQGTENQLCLVFDQMYADERSVGLWGGQQQVAVNVTDFSECNPDQKWGVAAAQVAK